MGLIDRAYLNVEKAIRTISGSLFYFAGKSKSFRFLSEGF